MRFNHLLNNFSSGEWSPKARARSEVQQYQNACEELLNFIPQMQGGAFRRPGTSRVTLDSAYQSDIQNAFDNVEWFIMQSKMIPRVLSDNTVQLLIAMDTLPSTTWVVYDVGTPSNTGALGSVSAAADVAYSSDSLQYAQVGDLVIIVDGNGTNPPRVWHQETYTTGKLQEITDDYLTYFRTTTHFDTLAWKSVPYRPLEALDSSVYLTPSGAAGTVTLTASAAFFNAGHVGAYFKLSNNGNTGLICVTGYTNATTVTAQWRGGVQTVADFGRATAATSSWEEAAWSDYRGWPRSVVAYQGRLYYGGNDSQPDTIWASRVGNIFDMMERPLEQDAHFTGYTDDNSRPFSLTPNSAEASNIVAMSSDKTLVIHTDRSEITAYGTNSVLGPNDFMLESSSSFGANRVQPVRADNYALFIKRGGRRLCEFTFTDTQDKYKAADLAFLADHLTLDNNFPYTSNQAFYAGGILSDPIVEMVSSRGSNNVVYCKTQNGRLLGITLSKDYQINAWFQVELGGSGSSDGSLPPIIKSIVAIPNRFDEDDIIFLLVARYVNGAYVTHLEYFSGINEGEVLLSAYVDGYKTGSTMDGLTWAGFTQYIGETLQVYADDQYIGEYTVDGSGRIVTTTVYTELSAGYKYTSRLKTMPIEIGQQVPGSPSGIVKRVDEAIVKFYLTRGAKYGHSVDKLYDIDFKETTANMNAQPTLYTGIKRIAMPTDYGRECQIIIEQDKPWPCNILGIVSSGITYG